MKKTFISMAVAAILLAGCGNNKNNHQSHSSHNHEGTSNAHTHEDGSVHDDHQTSEAPQETFKIVPNDSSVRTKNEVDHHHNSTGNQHKHESH
jgi:ABC-type enterochelin transport system substrate-binding protein